MGKVKQAGAIVLRYAKSSPDVLLVSAKRNPHHWIFPKGHIEPGETAAEAALREAEEEAGVTGRLLGRAGQTKFSFGPASYFVEYWLAETGDSGEPEAGRRLIWCGYEEAIERLTFDNTRALLRKVWKKQRF